VTTRFDRVVPSHGSVGIDTALSTAFVLADIIAITLAANAGSPRSSAWRPVGLVVVSVVVGATLLLRRQRPLVVLAVVIAGFVVAGAFDQRLLWTQRTGAQLVLAVYSVASWSTYRRRSMAAMLVLAGLVALIAAKSPATAITALSVPAAVVGAPWFAGCTARARRRHLADVEAQLVAAETDREERARRAVADERAHIARELHDVIAHHVSLIGVQAGAARTTLGVEAERARSALAGIEASSREVLREMRQLLNMLDTGRSDGTLVAPPREVEFTALCAGFTAAGLSVVGPPFPAVETLPPLAALTVYRVVEEALTNVTRHSQARTCTVSIESCQDGIEVIICDAGPTRTPTADQTPGNGRGLPGMRERLKVLGGDLSCGPSGDGFEVHAWFPVDPT
jgi:signal transduction histidine kinase